MLVRTHVFAPLQTINQLSHRTASRRPTPPGRLATVRRGRLYSVIPLHNADRETTMRVLEIFAKQTTIWPPPLALSWWDGYSLDSTGSNRANHNELVFLFRVHTPYSQKYVLYTSVGFGFFCWLRFRCLQCISFLSVHPVVHPIYECKILRTIFVTYDNSKINNTNRACFAIFSIPAHTGHSVEPPWPKWCSYYLSLTHLWSERTWIS